MTGTCGWASRMTGWVSNINFEPHVGQEILTNMAAGCGDLLDVRRETVMLEVAKQEDGLWNVVFRGADGKKYTVTADVLIDGTELGDVAKACGVEYRIGMEASSETEESIAPEEANDVIQDLTMVSMLKDYGPDADMTIEMPQGYDPAPYYNCAVNPKNTEMETGQALWTPEMMVTYGRTPNGKYMINWPIYGNDYYVNTIEMTPQERQDAYAKAKDFTLGFVYFIQTELGMKHLGLADDEFPTEDGLALIPYHRESRRIKGEASLPLTLRLRRMNTNTHTIGQALRSVTMRSTITISAIPTGKDCRTWSFIRYLRSTYQWVCSFRSRMMWRTL